MSFLRAVVHGPRVLFADEPLSHLDVPNATAVIELMRLWKAGEIHGCSPDRQRTLILVTHDLDETYDLADCFLVFSQDENPANAAMVPREQVDAEGGLNRLREMLRRRAPTTALPGNGSS